jgi:hypothetical protein
MENEHEDDYFLSSVAKMARENAYRKYIQEQFVKISDEIWDKWNANLKFLTI